MKMYRSKFNYIVVKEDNYFLMYNKGYIFFFVVVFEDCIFVIGVLE